jgi:hypothetical protein
MAGKRIGRYTVLVLSAYFLYEVERAAPEVNKVVRATERWCRPVMAGKRCVDFVILTEESSTELVERMRPTLDSITVISDYRCRFTGDDVVGKTGGLDILATYVGEAWQELRKRNSPDYVHEPERAETIIVGNMENFDRRTAVQMGIKARRPWKPAKDSDRKEN